MPFPARNPLRWPALWRFRAVNETFGSTNITVSHDDAGNLIDDGEYGYTYDAWHRLVKVHASADSRAATIQTAEFDAKGRRIQKVVTNSGDLDATTVYLYNGSRIIETRDGSSNVVAQFIHGTRYIDESVMARITGKGDFYYHQDANSNVIALTDLAGSVLERYEYTAYGEMIVHQETSFGDRDGDQDVDATDKGTVGVTCTGTVSGACRVLDIADFNGLYEAADATAFDALTQGLSRHPGRTLTGVDQPFGHQGLLYESEIGSYQNRARQYHAGTRRFCARDPQSITERGNGGHPDSLTLYQYVRSNPLRHFDPTGLLTLTETRRSPGYCGAASVSWDVSFPGGAPFTGWLVQHPTRDITFTDCCGGDPTRVPQEECWEASRVIRGTILVAVDTFATEEFRDIVGSQDITGSLQFCSDAQVNSNSKTPTDNPSSWPIGGCSVFDTGDANSTDNAPSWWGDIYPLDFAFHELRADWDCCEESMETDMSVVP